MLRPSSRLALLTLGLLAPSTAGADPSLDRTKTPVALAWSRDGLLIAAQREERSLAIVEPDAWQVRAEWPIPFRPAGLAVAGDGTVLVGGQEGELIAIRDGTPVAAPMSCGRGPATVMALPEGRAAVACRWEERIQIVDWRAGRVVAEHPLDGSPGPLVATPDGDLVAADAFGGRLTKLTPGVAGSERPIRIEAMNVRGLAVSGDGRELLAVHMTQDRPMPINRTNLDWGLVVSSKLTAVRLTEFEPRKRPLNFRQLALDGSRHGAADPAGLAVSADGKVVLIAVGGADSVLKVDRTRGAQAAADLLPLGDSQTMPEAAVGRNPVAVAFDPSGRLVVTADAMGDTLTVLAAADLRPVASIRLGPGAERGPAEARGEALFRDGRLAMDRWMTCATCHPDGHTVGLNFDTLGDGDYGAAKNTPSLLGVGPTAPFAWLGRFKTLEDQVHQSIESSLQGPDARSRDVADLAAYLRSLSPPPPRRPADDLETRRGAEVFAAHGCTACHAPPHLSARGLRDPELPKVAERFNPPSLRGVARSAPYFHDGRAATLDAALDLHHPGRPDGPTADERAALKAYLESL